ncbi:hypothetical protein [Psychrobacter sp. FDAARGOS_221]|uniref:hypothetical protein n=1 Tax=Psychrobacter sp. FDAARGOS_221 TaxID=1975705 RepID=UPI000FD7DC9B|nr:hypothetical protein [Psychrobacter sp. FDAARGOS_221]
MQTTSTHSQIKPTQLDKGLVSKVILATALSSSLLLTACQKSDDEAAESDTADQTETQATGSAADSAAGSAQNDASQNGMESGMENGLEGNATDNASINDNNMPTQQNPEAGLDPYNLGANSTAPAANNSQSQAASGAATAQAPKAQAPKAQSSETQVTGVEYQDDQGRSMHVTFQTSESAQLQASLRLPSGKQILLTAPGTQGNNPTYRSADGSIELVTHQGGKSIDLMFEGQSVSLKAVDTDAAVVKTQ